MSVFQTEIIEIIQRTPGVKSFRFKPAEGLTFKPGQFFWVKIKVSGQDKEKPFSFSSSPTETGFIEFTKRITQSDFSAALNKMKVGDKAQLRLAFGDFTFEGEYDKIAFLSGGVGITPIRSICKYATDKKLPADIILLYSNRDQENIIFRQDFEDMCRQNDKLKVTHFITGEKPDKEITCGRPGYITAAAIKEEIPDYENRIFYICGPPGMVQHMIDILKNELSLGDEKIRRENFAGY